VEFTEQPEGRQAFVFMPFGAINQKQMLDGLAWLFALTIEVVTPCFLVFFR
jgi:hypothetical protein